MPQSDNHDPLNFGTAAPNDGETLFSGFTKIDGDLAYLFSIADNGTLRRSGTVAGLTSIANLQDGELVATRGYYSDADGGANIYIYHLTGRPTADGGFFIDGPGADDYFEAMDKTVANVLKFGAYSDGTNATATTAAIQAAATALATIAPTMTAGNHLSYGSEPHVLLPSGTVGYAIDSPISVICGIGWVQHSPLIITAAASSHNTWLTLGSDGDVANTPQNRRVRIEADVIRQTQVDGPTETDIGIKCIASYIARPYLKRANGFGIGIQFLGGYNEVALGDVRDNLIGADFVHTTDVFLNATRVLGGSFVWAGSTNAGEDHVGIRVRAPETNGTSDIIFIGQSYEYLASAASPGTVWLASLDAGTKVIRNTQFLDQRVESGSDTNGGWLTTTGQCIGARFEANNKHAFDAGHIRKFVSVSATSAGIGARQPEDLFKRNLVFDSGRLIDRWCAYNAAGGFIQNLERVVNAGASPTPPTFAKDTVVNPANNADQSLDMGTNTMGLRFDSTVAKTWCFEFERGSTGSATAVSFVAFDDATRSPNSTITAANTILQHAATTANLTWNTGAYGGFAQIGVLTNSATTITRTITVSSAVKSFLLFFSNLHLRRFKVWTQDLGGAWFNSYSHIWRNEFLATQAPAFGTWAVGMKVFDVAPAAAGKMGWVCTAAGSPGTWKQFGAIDS
jgi:hypothetical protein